MLIRIRIRLQILIPIKVHIRIWILPEFYIHRSVGLPFTRFCILRLIIFPFSTIYSFFRYYHRNSFFFFLCFYSHFLLYSIIHLCNHSLSCTSFLTDSNVKTVKEQTFQKCSATSIRNEIRFEFVLLKEIISIWSRRADSRPNWNNLFSIRQIRERY